MTRGLRGIVAAAARGPALALSAIALLSVTPGTLAGAAEPGPREAVVIGCKNFTEQVILGEMFTILLEEHAGARVQRRFSLGGSSICFEALKSGEIDVYPEYTGTALTAILNLPSSSDREQVYRTVKRAYATDHDLHWLSPLRFDNTYTLTVTRQKAEELGLRTISDLAPLAKDMVLGATHEFIERPDGLPGIRQVYGFSFGTVHALDPGLTYKAVREGTIDVCDAYATDGRIEAFDLRVLEDDRDFFPPYPVAPVVTGKLLRERPRVIAALEKLAGLVTDEEMRSLNFEVDQDGLEAKFVARRFLAEKGLAEPPAARGASSRDSFLAYMWAKRGYLLGLTGAHLLLTGVAVFLATLFGLPFGILLSRRPHLAPAALMVVNVIQTIPSLALLGFLIPLLGIGAVPAVAALFLYALLPIVRNTYTGIRGVSASLVEAARGLGMTPRQILFMVELPLALPVIMAGVRTSTVINIGTATLAALIGASGLGEPIFRGIAMVNSNVILSGAVPAALLALTADFLLGRIERWLAR